MSFRLLYGNTAIYFLLNVELYNFFNSLWNMTISTLSKIFSSFLDDPFNLVIITLLESYFATGVTTLNTKPIDNCDPVL